MDQIKRLITGAQEILGTMTGSQRLLIGSIGVIAAMSLFLVVQYSGRPEMVDLFPTGDAATQQSTLTALQQAGIPAEVEGGKVVVPTAFRAMAVSQLAETGALPNDTTLLFANLLDRQGFYYSKQQNEQMTLIALQNELARVLRGFSGIREATVFMDVPQTQGLGRSVRKPTASATVFTNSGSAITQREVDAIADLIAGAKAGLDVESIRVIDGTMGRQHRPTNPDQMMTGTYLEVTAAHEEKLQRKLSELLAYIRGVTIAVTAQVDVTRSSTQSKRFLPNKEGSVQIAKMTSSDSTSQGQANKAAQPGVGSNTTGSIYSSGGGGNSTTIEDSQDQTEFEVGLGTEVTTEQDPHGMPTLLAASVNIPRSYIVEQIKAAAAEGEEVNPTETEIEARFADEKSRIEASIEPHLQVAGVGPGGSPIEGKVVVNLIPVDVIWPAMGGSQAGLLGNLAGGGGGGMMGGGLIEKGLLAFLALGAMGMMLMMVRKATKPAELPSAEELAGVPPTLPTANDMVGEADESEAAMTGIEIGDDEIRSRKLVEQVVEMVGSNPDSAAGLLGRWVSDEQ
jgi:flagellar M-ring protein FliF